MSGDTWQSCHINFTDPNLHGFYQYRMDGDILSVLKDGKPFNDDRVSKTIRSVIIPFANKIKEMKP
jgi:hypothetical protein